MNVNKNWEGFTNLGHPNWTGKTPSRSSGYKPGTENPPCGWCIAIVLGLAAFWLLLFGPTMAARWIGL